MTYIAHELKPHFQESELFAQLDALEGEVFRDVAGRRTLKFSRGGKAYFAKIHHGAGWSEIFKNLLQLRLPVLGAQNEWLALNRLQQIGVLTMEPVLFVSEGWNPATVRSCVVTRSLENTVSLEDFVFDQRFTVGRKRKLIQRIAEISQQLHSRGLNHRDYYLCHFLMDLDSLANEKVLPRLYLIDLHRVQIRDKTPRRWRVKDIGGLLFSAFDAGLTRRDLYRFVRWYTPGDVPLRQILTRDARFWQLVIQRALRLYYQDHDNLSPEIEKLLAGM